MNLNAPRLVSVDQLTEADIDRVLEATRLRMPTPAHHQRHTEPDPANMGTTAGIEAVKDRAAQAASSMRHFRISATAVVLVLLACPFLGAVGWAIAARYFN